MTKLRLFTYCALGGMLYVLAALGALALVGS